MISCLLEVYRAPLFSGQTENIAKPWFEGTIVDFPAWTTAFFAALWSYSGWYVTIRGCNSGWYVIIRGCNSGWYVIIRGCNMNSGWYVTIIRAGV